MDDRRKAMLEYAPGHLILLENIERAAEQVKLCLDLSGGAYLERVRNHLVFAARELRAADAAVPITKEEYHGTD